MSNSLRDCNCDVIHEDIQNDVKRQMQPKDDYIQLASLFKLFWRWHKSADPSMPEQERDAVYADRGSAGRH